MASSDFTCASTLFVIAGEVSDVFEGDLPEEPLPNSWRETPAGPRDGLDHDAGLKLVQKQKAAGPDATVK